MGGGMSTGGAPGQATGQQDALGMSGLYHFVASLHIGTLRWVAFS
jgi:hypothetical protein